MSDTLVEIDTRPTQPTDSMTPTASDLPFDRELEIYKHAYYGTAESRQVILGINELINHINTKMGKDDSDNPVVRIRLPERPSVISAVADEAAALKSRGFDAQIHGNISYGNNSTVAVTLALDITPSCSTPQVAPIYFGGVFEIPKEPCDENGFLCGDLAYYKRHFELLGWYCTKLVDIVNAYEYIGDFSQNVWGMSFAQDVVREYWAKGNLNQGVKDYVEISVISEAKLMGRLYREDGDYQSELTRLIAKINAWPTDWGYDLNTLDSLTAEEAALVAPLRKDDNIVKALEHSARVIDKQYGNNHVQQASN